MTSDQFVREIERLMARKQVRPATPEYLAEIDAQIDRLRSEYAAQSSVASAQFAHPAESWSVAHGVEGAEHVRTFEVPEPKGVEAIVANGQAVDAAIVASLANIKEILRKHGTGSRRNREMLEKLEADIAEGLAKGEILNLSYAIEDVQYGIGRVANHPEPPSRE